MTAESTDLRHPDAPKALIADDCRVTLLLFRHILEPEGLRADTAASGREALEKALDRDYAAVVLDILFPDLDGVTVARRLRAARGERTPPIWLLTGMGELFREELIEAAGAEGVFFKPIVPSVVAESARAVLGGLSSRHGTTENPPRSTL